MSSELSKLMLANGFNIKQRRKDRRDADSNQQLAQLLQQGKINQNQAQTEYYNKQSRGQDLQNTQRAREMARGPQNKFEQRTGNDGSLYNVELNPQGGVVNSTRMENMGTAQPKALKIPASLFSHLTPEQQGNPSLVTSANLVAAARAKNEFDKRPDPMAEMNARAAQTQFDADQLKLEELQTKKRKGEELGKKSMSLATELLNHGSLNNSVGTLQGSWLGQKLTVDDDSQNFINKHNQLKSILTAENLDMMSGVLSETDIVILSDIAGGSLMLSGSEKAYRDELLSLGGVREGALPDGTKDNGDGTFTLPNGMIVEKE